MYLKYVNPKIGTLNDNRFSHGNIYPVVARPNGLAFFTIQTRAHNQRWWYHPYDRSFEGIRLTHQPSPWVGDYGHFLLLPHSGEYQETNDRRWSSFDKDKEIITPYEMKGFLLRYLVEFSLTPSFSGAILNLIFQKEDKKALSIIGLDGTLNCEKIDDYNLRLTTDAKVEEADPKIIEYIIIQT
ncbi:MAG: hypothetical protein GX794_04495, partial [Acholeplasmataceae bacterium]|nr:hypothetical protein [Acholeplasmataceae bacterium]